MTTQANQEVAPLVDQNASTMVSHMRDFTRMNPPILFGSKAKEDPKDFLDEFYKILYAMGVTSNEKDELATYQLKDVAQTWYTQWKENRVLRVGPLSWEILSSTFFDRFFPREKREAKVEEFINLRQGGIIVQKYCLKFIKLSKYASHFVTNSRYEMSRFVTDLSDDLVE